jgi:hypothetical protein
VIRGIPAGAFENNPGRGQDLAQPVLAAFRAALEGFIAKRLMALELHTAAFTPISIDRHSDSLSERRVIIASFAGSDKTLSWRLYRCLILCKVAIYLDQWLVVLAWVEPLTCHPER